MHILRHLYLNSVHRSPDDPAAPPADPVIPPADPLPADPPVAGDPPADPPVAGDPPADPPAPPVAKPPVMIPIRVLHERVGKVEQRATQAEQRAADLQATIDRINAERATAGDPPAAPRAPSAPAAPARSQAEFDTAVRAEAQRQQLYNDTVAIRSAGEGKFNDFGDTLSVLTAIGATNDDFISDVIAVDRDTAHDILDRLAKDPEKAASMVAMDPRRRIAELTRMSDTIRAAVAPKPAAGDPPAPKPAALSRAPAPKPALAPQAPAPDIDPTTPEGNEKMSDAQFEKWYKDKYMKRA